MEQMKYWQERTSELSLWSGREQRCACLSVCLPHAAVTFSYMYVPLQGSPTLPLVAVSFALNGTLLGVQNISNQILLCQDRPSHTQAAWRVGVAYQIEVYMIDQNNYIPKS